MGEELVNEDNAAVTCCYSFICKPTSMSLFSVPSRDMLKTNLRILNFQL